jgi:peroxiredoxin Q/BCP
MLRTLLSTCLAITLLCVHPTVHAEPPTEFSLESPTHDTTLKLSDLKGKVVALHFLLKTECPYCLKYTRTYAKAAEKDTNVVHLFIKPDSAEEIKAWAAHMDATGLKEAPVIYRDVDASLADSYKIPSGYQFHGQTVHFPAVVVLNDQGSELFRYVGKNNSDRLSYADFQKRLAAAQKKDK